MWKSHFIVCYLAPFFFSFFFFFFVILPAPWSVCNVRELLKVSVWIFMMSMITPENRRINLTLLTNGSHNYSIQQHHTQKPIKIRLSKARYNLSHWSMVLTMEIFMLAEKRTQWEKSEYGCRMLVWVTLFR